jgi:cell division septation protein DedD
MDYIAKAKKLSKVEQERVLSRMDGKLPKQLRKEKITLEKAIALQLELEDVQLTEWRKKMAEMRTKELAKLSKEKAKAEAKLAKTKIKDPSKEKKVAVQTPAQVKLENKIPTKSK